MTNIIVLFLQALLAYSGKEIINFAQICYIYIYNLYKDEDMINLTLYTYILDQCSKWSKLVKNISKFEYAIFLNKR